MIRLPWQNRTETAINKEELAKNLAEQQEQAKKEEDALPCYQIGVSKDNRVTLRLGDGVYYSTLTMTNEGVDRMIRMLEAAKDQCIESACDSEQAE